MAQLDLLLRSPHSWIAAPWPCIHQPTRDRNAPSSKSLIIAGNTHRARASFRPALDADAQPPLLRPVRRQMPIIRLPIPQRPSANPNIFFFFFSFAQVLPLSGVSWDDCCTAKSRLLTTYASTTPCQSSSVMQHPLLSAPCLQLHQAAWHSVRLFVFSRLFMSCPLQNFCSQAPHSRTTAS
ncbi:uncharacterized protein IWZ02DRAFT_459309, partial [Phyllosticta citriasiana]|uniref:uncharacterized protein n=1 Tax=Phyllosticta citriasiana TaxID=595635 RepID=UPI0030FDD837